MLSQVNKHVRIYVLCFKWFKKRWNTSLHTDHFIVFFSREKKFFRKGNLFEKQKASKANMGLLKQVYHSSSSKNKQSTLNSIFKVSIFFFPFTPGD